MNETDWLISPTALSKYMIKRNNQSALVKIYGIIDYI